MKDYNVYKIEYIINENKLTNFHYFIAKNAIQAVRIETKMCELKKVSNLKIKSVEKWDRFREEWEDETDLVILEITNHNKNFKVSDETAWAKKNKS